MMISSISSATQAPPVTATPAKGSDAKKPDTSATPQRVDQTTVTLSSAALAAQAAAKEATETPQQTAKEAGKNDHQAQRLLAKEAAAAATRA